MPTPRDGRDWRTEPEHAEPGLRQDVGPSDPMTVSTDVLFDFFGTLTAYFDSLLTSRGSRRAAVAPGGSAVELGAPLAA
jgi:hypothetical protein